MAHILYAVTASLSSLASGWLFIVIQRLPSNIRSKLLARQLWHMSLADFWGYTMLALGFAIPNLSCLPSLAYRIGIVTAALVEVHIAFSMLAKIRRWNTGLRCLSQSLPLVWILGFALGGTSVAITYSQMTNSRRSTNGCASGSGGANFKNITLIISAAICFSVYVNLGMRQFGTGAHQRHAFNRAGLLLSR